MQNCPRCRSKMQIDGTRNLHPLLNQSYARCKNFMCSAVYKLNSELIVISKQQTNQPEYTLDMQQAIDIATAFINANSANQNNFIKCIDYLIDTLQCDYEQAVIIKKQALANIQNNNKNNWIELNNSTTASVIVSCDGQRHCVTIDDILTIANQNKSALAPSPTV